MKVGIIGAGRIGKVHAKNISMFVPEMEIKTIADPFMNEQTEAFAKQYGIPNCTKDANDILNDPEIEAVLICSSTDTHSKYIIEAAHAKKHIFCEKPIDYDLNKVHEAIDAAKEAGVKLRSVSAAALTTTTVPYTTWCATARSARSISLRFPPATRSRPRYPTSRFPAVSSMI